MPFKRSDIQDSVNRAGEDHMDALIEHHEEAYPQSRPTPGDICAAEAKRLNEMGLADADGFQLRETRVERVGDRVQITHVFEYGPLGVRLMTEPHTGYD